MKSTYRAPAATPCGDVVGSTLGGKIVGTDELGVMQKRPSGGSALSFGL